MRKISDTSVVDGVTYRQSDFLSTLDNAPTETPKTIPSPATLNPQEEKKSEKRPLPRNQQAGFRRDYEDAKVTLYIIGVLFNSEKAKASCPEEIKKEFEHAKKVQERYERYMPTAAQSIVHFGREVVDAYTCGNSRFLNQKEEEAYAEAESIKKRLQKNGKTLTGPSPKQRMLRFSIDKIEQMISIVQLYNIM